MSEEVKPMPVEKEEAPVEEGVERIRNRRAYLPRTDIYETDTEVVIVADMPGVDAKTVEVTLEKNVLTINGYVEPREPEGYALSYAEYNVGDFQRSFTLSVDIDRDKIEAVVRDGVLRLRLPKAPEAAAKKIAVKSG
mgnify:CR=1 FL=1